MTIAQLARAWSYELGRDRDDPKHRERDLVHILLEDIINGRLDSSGPDRNGQRLGLRWVTDNREAAYVEGTNLRELIGVKPTWVLDNVVVMKEAALDFARRRRLPLPSWWVDDFDIGPRSTRNAVGNTPKSASPSLGKQPRIMEYLSEHYPGGVPHPAQCPRKALRSAIIAWDSKLAPLDEETLKRTIDNHNSRFTKSPN
jgi:hypothetical protein